AGVIIKVMGELNRLPGSKRSWAACLYNPTGSGPQNLPSKIWSRLREKKTTMLNPVICLPVRRNEPMPDVTFGSPGNQLHKSQTPIASTTARETSFPPKAQYSNPCQAK